MTKPLLVLLPIVLTACATVPAPTPTPTLTPAPTVQTLRIELSTTSDWTELNILNSNAILDVRLVDKQGDLTHFSANKMLIGAYQTLEEAHAVNKVGITVDLDVSVPSGMTALSLRLEKGSINESNVRFYKVVNGEAALLLDDVSREGYVAGNDERNPYEFHFDLRPLLQGMVAFPTPARTPLPMFADAEPISIGDKSGALTFLVGTSGGGFQLKLAATDGSRVKALDKKLGKIWDYAWGANRQVLVVLASASSTGAKILYLLDLSGSPPLQLSGEDADVAAFDLGPDGTSVVFGTVRPATHNTSVFFAAASAVFVAGASMDAGPAVRIAQLDGVAVKSVAWSPDGSLVSIGAEDTQSRFNELKWYTLHADGTDLRTIDTKEHSKWSGWITPVVEAAWMPMSNKLAMNSEFLLSLYDAATGEMQLLKKLPPYEGFQAESMVWSPDGASLAYSVQRVVMGPSTRAAASTVNIYSVSKGSSRPVGPKRNGQDNLAWSPDGNELAYTECNRTCSVYRLNIGTGAVSEVLTGQGPEVAGLRWTDKVQMVESAVPATATPVAAWEALSQPPVFDDFEGKSLDLSRWRLPRENSDAYSYMQEYGRFIVDAREYGTDAQDFNLNLAASRPLAALGAFEVKLKLQSGSKGFAFAKIGIGAQSPELDWVTVCRFGNAMGDPTAQFDVATTGYHVLYRTQAVPIHFDQWYIVRIEISPENGAVQYYLDGKLIDTYLPDDAEKLLEPETAFTPGIGVWKSYATIGVQFDEVRIGTAAVP